MVSVESIRKRTHHVNQLALWVNVYQSEVRIGFLRYFSLTYLFELVFPHGTEVQSLVFDLYRIKDVAVRIVS